MGDNVKKFIEHGPLFSEGDDVTEEEVNFYQQLLDTILREEVPVTIEEAKMLMLQFNNKDSSFGLAWTLLNIIESVVWSYKDCIAYIDSVRDSLNGETEWIDLIETRYTNSILNETDML